MKWPIGSVSGIAVSVLYCIHLHVLGTVPNTVMPREKLAERFMQLDL